jgi:hypothetical protein
MNGEVEHRCRPNAHVLYVYAASNETLHERLMQARAREAAIPPNGDPERLAGRTGAFEHARKASANRARELRGKVTVGDAANVVLPEDVGRNLHDTVLVPDRGEVEDGVCLEKSR